MHAVPDVRRTRGPNCDSEYFLIRIRCINKIRKMQERFKKRMKWNSRKLGGAIISQKFKHDMIIL